MEIKEIEFNSDFKKAIDLIENSKKNVFITGKAGTGKSTLLSYFKKTTKKKAVFLAPTGVSALNIGGQTLHSFFRFGPDITEDKIEKVNDWRLKIYKKIETIVIDEISMLRADILDYVDIFLRKNLNKNIPFAGIQMIFIGDLYQLPPVVKSDQIKIFKDKYNSEYFFDSNSFKSIDFEFIELEKIYRQKDDRFIEILNRIRNNTVTDSDIKELNKRVVKEINEDEKYMIYLTPLNKTAKEINEKKLISLNKKIYSFKSIIKGDFRIEDLPADDVLKLAKGAQVMFLNNDVEGRWVNGTLGTVIDFSIDNNLEKIITVELENGEIVHVKPHKWEVFRYIYDETTKKIKTETIGQFIQFPLKLAWAITIHKSQGKTFNRVFIDLRSGTFAHGQAYVAFSRCTTLKGIHLKHPIDKKHIIMDRRIINFITSYKYKLSQKEITYNIKEEIIKEAIEKKSKLTITYLKTNGEKTLRIIIPIKMEEIEFKNKKINGLTAYCELRNDKRFFKIDRIIDIRKA